MMGCVMMEWGRGDEGCVMMEWGRWGDEGCVMGCVMMEWGRWGDDGCVMMGSKSLLLIRTSVQYPLHL